MNRDAVLAAIRAKSAAMASALSSQSDDAVRESAVALGIDVDAVSTAQESEEADKTKASSSEGAVESIDLDARVRMVRDAVEKRFSEVNAKGMTIYAWAEVVYDDKVVIRKERKLYEIGYALSKLPTTKGTSVVVNGQPIEVKVEYAPVEEAVASGESDRVESAKWSTMITGPVAESTDGGMRWNAILIESGLSKNRNNYRPEVLEAAASMYEGVPIYVDHAEAPRRFGRSFHEAVGFVRNVKTVSVASEAKGETRLAVAGEVVMVDEAVDAKMRRAWEAGARGLFGLSHDAGIKWKPMRVGAMEARDIESITGVKSVDLVMNPAAGGRFAGIAVESTDQGGDTMRERMLAKLKELGRTAVLESLGDSATDEQVAEAYEKAIAEEAVKASEPAKGAGDGKSAKETKETAKESVTDPNAEIVSQMQALNRRLLEADIREAVSGAGGLPEESRKIMLDRYIGRVNEAAEQGSALPSIDGIRKEIADQIKFSASIVEAHGVRMPVSGLTRIEITKTYRDQAEQRLSDFWEGKEGAQSIRGAYVDITGDHRVTGKLSDATRIRESLDTSSWAEVMGDSLTRAMLPFYKTPDYANWREIATVVPLNDYRQQRRLRVGGYGNLFIVGQGQPFPSLTSPGDEEVTYSPAKRGGTEDITIEMIRNDDVGAVRLIPQRLGRAAAQTLYEFVFDFMRTNAATSYDSTALAAVGHANLITTALTASNLQLAWQYMKKQADMSNGKRLGLSLKHLWVPTELAELAWELTQAKNKMPDANLATTGVSNAPSYTREVIMPTPHVVDYWTDADNWWATASKDQGPMLEIGFVDGEDPQLLIQDQPNVGMMFSNEKLTWKIRHVYGGAPSDHRMYVGGIVG